MSFSKIRGLVTKLTTINRCGALSPFASKSKHVPMGCNSSKLEITKRGGERTAETKMAATATHDDDDHVEAIVCKVEDVQENEMKTFDIGSEGKVLIVRQNGEWSALGAKCTHYGAPLVNGALGAGRVRCQWHGACFNVTSGDIEDFPGLDSLPCYQLTLEDGNVKVRARKSDLTTGKRVKIPTDQQLLQPTKAMHFVVVGGGAAASVCIETLRQEGFLGAITVIAKEPYLPYDRIKLSKTMDVNVHQLEFRNEDFYATHKIQFRRGAEAVAFDATKKRITLKDGATLQFDAAFVATGSRPRTISRMRNVFVVREYDDVTRIHAALSGVATPPRVLVLGSSFIGMEAAAYCSGKAASVTVISKDDAPFAHTFGARIGTAVQRLFESKGVRFVCNSGVKRCLPQSDDDDVPLEGVELTNGDVLEADLLILGIGSVVNTDFLKDSDVTLNANGTIEVDEFLATSVAGVYAGGDVAHAPIHGRREKAAIGHFGLAQYHGRVAALNMLGGAKRSAVKSVPFFWSMLMGKNIRYAGYGRFTDVLYEGDVEQLKFVAFYLSGDEVVGVSACQMDPIVSRYAELVAQGVEFSRDNLHRDLLGF